MEIGKLEIAVVVSTYEGDEAKTLLAQAAAYRRISLLMLKGLADRDPTAFVQDCKAISFEAARDGA